MSDASQTMDDYLNPLWFVLLRTCATDDLARVPERGGTCLLGSGLRHVPVGELSVRQLNLRYVRLLESGGRRGCPLCRHRHLSIRCPIRPRAVEDPYPGISPQSRFIDSTISLATTPHDHTVRIRSPLAIAAPLYFG